MDELSSKRHAGGVVLSRKSSSLVSRDMTNNSKKDAQFCNRIGCSGRLKYSKPTLVTEKPKYSRPAFRSTNGRETIGGSSTTAMKKSSQGSQSKISSNPETDSSESSSIRGESDVSEITPPTTRNQKRFHTETREGNSSKVSPLNSSESKPGSGCQNVQPGPSVSSASKGVNSGVRSNSHGNKYGLKNLKCNSISDVIPHAGSPSEPKVNKRDVTRRSPEGESSSSSKGKRSSGTTCEERRFPLSTSGISIPSSRRTRNWAASNDNTTAAARIQRSLNSNNRMRFSNLDNSNGSLLTESSDTILALSRPATQIDASMDGLSSQSNDLSSYSSSDDSPSIMPLTSVEQGVSHVLRRYNLNGVAEMLMALERIEQDEELSYEQFLALETNLFLGSLNLYDQHRDMRLDIDNMSYEELLALEERMGTVSTALPEEALAKSLRITIYQNSSLELGYDGYGNDEGEMKCSICQEEYVIGDEIGKLACQHGYHGACIQQWLRLKNWCPICKTSAAPSSPPSSSQS